MKCEVVAGGAQPHLVLFRRSDEAFFRQKTNTSRRNPPKPNLVRHPFFDRPTPWWSVGVAPAYNCIFVPNTHSLSCLDIVEAYCILRLASAAYQRHEPSAHFSSICRPFVSLGGGAIAPSLCSSCSRCDAPDPLVLSHVVVDDKLPGLRRTPRMTDSR